MTAKRSITPAAIARLKPGELIWDRECPGLLVNANGSGLCSWRFLRKRRDGRIFRKTFGTTATFDIIEARAWARSFNAIIERGGDPGIVLADAKAANDAKRARQAMTLRVAWELYLSTLEREGNHVLKTLEMKRCRFRKDVLPTIGDKPLSEIEHDDLWQIVEAKKNAGFASASNHLVPDIKVFFKWCITYGRTATGLRRNPAVDLIKLSRDRSRRRTFSLLELRLFVRALASCEDPFAKRLFSLLLLSGQRIGNVLRAQPIQWCDELDAWEIERTKNDEPNVVPLSRWGRALFGAGNESWVFPSARGDGPRLGHIVVLYRDIRARMQSLAPEAYEVKAWTPHDLRRVIRTHMARLRVRREIAERVIAHKPSGVEAIYDRYEYLDEKRDALSLWEHELVRIASEENVAALLGIPDESSGVVDGRLAA